MKGRGMATGRPFSWTPVLGTELVPRPGSCSIEYVRGREAVMPQFCLDSILADCEYPFILQEVGNVED